MKFERLAPEHHDTLPETPEPQENPALVGHGEAAALAACAYRDGRLHHALLLAGPAGIGKATFAFHLARHLLTFPDASAAPNRLAPADPASQAFRLIAQEAHPSVLHLTRPWNDKTKKWGTVISVEEIRRVGHFLSLRSHDGGYRIVIVDPVDDLNRAAANALLKSLEEPPSRTLFILVAHSAGRLLPTIRSRCQTVRMPRLGTDEMMKTLAAVGFTGDAAAIVPRSNGSPRNAILLQQLGGLDIMGAADQAIEAQVFDVAQAQKLGDVLAGRDNEMRFELFNRHLLDRVALAARDAALGGRRDRSEAQAALWQALSASLGDTIAYNLDRKQHVVDALQRANEALSR